jgi:plasmid stabilization system protein ParE
VNPTVWFHPFADLELNEAAYFYDAESPGLGTVFLDEVEHTIDRIVEHPNAGTLVAGTVRRRLIPRFPYAVLYSVKGDTIRILAIMHQKRRPFYWKDRG